MTDCRRRISFDELQWRGMVYDATEGLPERSPRNP